MEAQPVSEKRALLKSVFGYEGFRPGQEQLIDALLQGRDAMGIMPTGAGKSMCYQLPALLLLGITLVVSPLISLMKDQVNALVQSGVRAAYLNSSLTEGQTAKAIANAMEGVYKIIYVAPERLFTPRFQNFAQGMNISMVCVDEAHCVSQWGQDFRPGYLDIARFLETLPRRPVVGAFTATATGEVREDIVRLLGLNDPLIQINSFDRPNIRYMLMEKFKPLDQLMRYVQEQRGKSGIIYCNSRAKVEDTAARLQSKGISAAAYHAGLENNVRADVQEKFQRDDLQIVVATVAFGMGINKPNVRFVVHFDIPRNIESYYQETGRAGRDGLPAEAMLFYDPADMAWLRRCLEEKPQGQLQDIERHKLNAMGAFAEAQTCRRLVLLNYFGEGRQEPCGNCDICLDPPKQYDGSTDAQIALSTIGRVNQRFGMGYVVEVIRGANNQRIRDYGHDKLKVYGMGRDKSHEHWVSVIRQLIHLGLVTQNIAQHSALQLTEAARPVLRGESSLQLAVPRIVALKPKAMQKSFGGNYDRKLFAKLRKLRKSIADESNVPPYVVFNDATLIEMAEQMPITASEMLSVNGVGMRKLERFGKPFMALIRAHVDGDDEE